MSTVTALQLVNRVLRRARETTVTQIDESEERALVVLDIVNDAVGAVLSTRDWDFDERHDGILRTVAKHDVVESKFTFTTDSAYVTITDAPTYEDWTGDRVTRLVNDVDEEYGSTAFRLVNMQQIGQFQVCQMNTDWPGTDWAATGNTQAGYMYVSEYILPDTVKDVLSVSLEETPISLRSIDPRTQYEDVVPRAHSQFGRPKWVAVGGYEVPTHAIGQTDPLPGLRMIVWPVPDDAYMLKFMYRYRHPRMESGSAKLVGVPDEVISHIVQSAHAEYQATVEKDIQVGLANENRVRTKVNETYLVTNPQPAKRHTISAWDRGPRAWDPRGGFPPDDELVE